MSNFKVRIYFKNGSMYQRPFKLFTDVQDFYRHGISYSGGKVKRVEVIERDGSVRAIWDASWDDFSKARGLAA